MATWTELVEERNQLVNRLQSISETAEAEFKVGKRAAVVLTPEEQENTDQLTKDLDIIEGEITAVQKQRELANRIDQANARGKELEAWGNQRQRQPVETQITRNRKPNSGTQYMEEFREWLGTGQMGYQMRALAKDPDISGGFTVAPEEFLADLIRKVDDLVQIRQLARVITTTANTVGVPVLNNKLAAATWGTELSLATADATMNFGKRRLTPHPETAQILVSKLLPLQASIPIDELVRSEFARVVGELQEIAFMNGNGNQQPLGVFRADPMGISTGADVTASASSANQTADNLIATLYSLKPQYRRNAEWMFNRTPWLRGIRQLKDNNNQYLWTAGLGYTQSLVAGQGPQLLDRPYRESEFAPGTATAAGSSSVGTASSGYTAIVGDFKNYWIVDGASLGVQRYDQINAATNQDTYIGLFQVDGAPVLEEAFARARLSTQ